jgi:tRNA pseudouridine55 synthase
MDGILNVLKPPGMTSFDVVAHLRGLLGTRKIGHAGTLDPLAVGVLPVCAGKATKAIEFLMDKDKHYRAELTLGIATDTQDSAGEIVRRTVPACTDEEIVVSVRSFIGIYNQLPPMYSALKVNGRRMYELARSGQEAERQPRGVRVFSAEVLEIDRSDGVKVLLDVHCSKGTYIRTLCADIGERIGCGGHMSFLLRRKAGPFDIADSYTLEELAQKRSEGTLQTALQGIDSVFAGMPGIRLDAGSEKKFMNGMAVRLPAEGLPGGEMPIEGTPAEGPQSGEPPVEGPLTEGLPAVRGKGNRLVRVYDSQGRFVAIGEGTPDESGLILKGKKMFFGTGEK